MHSAARRDTPAPVATSAVTITPPPTGTDRLGRCPALMAALPDSLSGHRSRPVAGADAGRAAAWGDPAIVLRCGVPKPASLVPGSPLINVQGVDWDTYPLGGNIRWTAANRQVYVEVLIPQAYPGQGALIADLSPVVAAHDPAG